MKKTNPLFLLIFLSSMASFLGACSDDKATESKENDHVWKHQTDTLKTSKDVAKKLQDSLNQQQQKMDESN